MSKMDDLRKMREARYEAAQARAKATGPRPASRVRPAVAPAEQPAAPEPTAGAPRGSAPAPDSLCGHRNMSGRTCTREKGHSQKSHRYS